MMQNNHLGFFRRAVVLPALILIVVLGVMFSSAFSPTPQNQQVPKKPTSTPLSSTTIPDLTAGWKTFSDKRPNMSLNFKYSPGWDDPFDHCDKPSTSHGFGISP